MLEQTHVQTGFPTRLKAGKVLGIISALSCGRLVFVLWIAFFSTLGHAQESVWAEHQQAVLAQEILGEDEYLSMRAVGVAEQLGPRRMSDEVRVALIELMEQLSDQQDIALAEGTPTNDVVNFEFFMHVVRVVASLDDPRAIPALARVGNYGFSRPAALGLASFGEQALPAILDVVDAPEVSYHASEYSMIALAMMVEDGGMQNLAMSARRDIARVARNGLRSQWSSILGHIAVGVVAERLAARHAHRLRAGVPGAAGGPGPVGERSGAHVGLPRQVAERIVAVRGGSARRVAHADRTTALA